MSSLQSKNFIFIGGVPRSGTSLIQKILDLHPDIYGGPEFDYLPALLHVYKSMKNGIRSGRQSTYYDQELLKNQFSTFVNNLLLKKLRSEGVKILSEKTPDNILVFEELKEVFPHAKFIFVVRDPRGIINSFQKVAQRAEKYQDQVAIGKNIFSDVAKTHKHLVLGDKFWKENPDCCYCLHYEKVVEKPKEEIQKLCDFLGVSFTEEMLNTQKRNESSSLISAQNKTTRAWYTADMYDRKIDSTVSRTWEKELDTTKIIYINNFFATKRISCLESYQFEKPSKFKRLQLIPVYFKQFGIGFLVKAIIKRTFAYGRNN